MEDIAIVHIVHLLLILLLLGQTLDILGNIICRAPCEIVVALLGCLDEITEVGGIGKVVGIIGSVVIVIPHPSRQRINQVVNRSFIVPSSCSIKGRESRCWSSVTPPLHILHLSRRKEAGVPLNQISYIVKALHALKVETHKLIKRSILPQHIG